MPFPNYNFDTIKSIYNDEEMEKEEEFLRTNQTHLNGSRCGNRPLKKAESTTEFRKTLLLERQKENCEAGVNDNLFSQREHIPEQIGAFRKTLYSAKPP